MNSLDVRCPVCWEPPGKRCRTLTTNRSTDTHALRFDAARRPRRDTACWSVNGDAGIRCELPGDDGHATHRAVIEWPDSESLSSSFREKLA